MATDLIIKFSELLTNDVGEGITVIAIGEPTQGGQAILDTVGKTITYTPPAVGASDSFTYQIQDRLNQKSTATVYISITGTVVTIKANDDEITKPYPSAYPYVLYLDTNLVLPNDTGANLRLLSVGDSTKHQTKGKVFYDTSVSPFIRYIPEGVDGGSTAARYPSIEYTYTQGGIYYGEIVINGAGNSVRMTPVVGQAMIISITTNTPQTGKSVAMPGSAWAPIGEASNTLLHTRLFYRDVDQAFVTAYNASGDQYSIAGAYAFDPDLDTFVDVELFLIGPAPGGSLTGKFNGGAVDLYQFGAFGGNANATIPWPSATTPVLWHGRIFLYNTDPLIRPTGSPDVYPSFVRQNLAGYSVTDYTNAPGPFTGSIAVTADYAAVLSWSWQTPAVAELPSITEDWFNYTITNNAGDTSTAEVHLLLTDEAIATDDNIVLPRRTLYSVITGTVRLTGHSDLYNLGYRDSGTINILGHIFGYDVTQLRQDMEGIIGPINNNNILPGVSVKVVDSQGFQIPDNHDFGFFRIYREQPFSDAELASLPPLLFGTASRSTSNEAPPYEISYSELKRNDTGRGIEVLSFTQPTSGRLVETDDKIGLIYTRPVSPVVRDTFTYTIKNAAGKTATANVYLTESTEGPPPPEVFPTATNDTIQLQGTTAEAATVRVPLSQITRNDTYEGDGVSIVFDFSRLPGASAYQENGFLVYVPPIPPQDDVISYTLTDSKGRTAAAAVYFLAPTTAPSGGSAIGGLPGTNVRQSKSVVGASNQQRMILSQAASMRSLLVAFMPQFDVTSTAGDWYNAKTEIAYARDNGAIATKFILSPNDTPPQLYIWDYTPTEETVTVFEISAPIGGGPDQYYFAAVDQDYSYTRNEPLESNEILIGVAIGLGGNLPTVEGATTLATTAIGARATVQPFFSNTSTTVVIRVPQTQSSQRLMYMSARIKVTK